MMGYGGFGAMAGLGWLGMRLGLLALIGVIALVVWGAGALLGQRSTADDVDTLELSRQRYARGEISQAEYEEATRRST